MTDGEIIDTIMGWIKTDGQIISDEQLVEMIKELTTTRGLQWQSYVGTAKLQKLRQTKVSVLLSAERRVTNNDKNIQRNGKGACKC